MLRDVAATTLKHVLLYSAYAKNPWSLISARTMKYYYFLCRVSCFYVAHRVARHCATCRVTLQLPLKYISLHLAYCKTSCSSISVRNRQYCPRWFDVTYRVARHCITCQNLLIINFSLKHALFLEMFYCRARALCRPTPRPCSYNFKTCSIVYSVCQNLLIINVSSNHALFLEIYLCRASCRATLQL